MVGPVTLDIPVPPSVNATRKIDWRGHARYKAWKRNAGLHLLANGQYRKAPREIGQYELTITLDEKQCAKDPDNIVKAASDLLKSLNIITDDSPKYARRVTIEWGTAPDGCRVTLRAVEAVREKLAR